MSIIKAEITKTWRAQFKGHLLAPDLKHAKRDKESPPSGNMWCAAGCDSLLASFLPASAARGCFYCCQQPDFFFCPAKFARIQRADHPRHQNAPAHQPRFAGEYHLLDLDGRQMLWSAACSTNPSRSACFPIETRFDAVLDAFSALEKLLNSSRPAGAERPEGAQE